MVTSILVTSTVLDPRTVTGIGSGLLRAIGLVAISLLTEMTGLGETARPALPTFSPRTYEKQFTRLLIAAGLSGHSPKCRRHTFASMLLTAGISLPSIALQLGHGSPVVTAAHYARWLARGYRAPLVLGPGEVAADLLTRLTSVESPKSPPSGLGVNAIDEDDESRKAPRFR